MEYYSNIKKNTFESVLMRWMKLEPPIINNKISQKEKHQYSILTARRSNQSILKEISLGISLERMMLKLKLQYFGHLMLELTHWKRV